MAFGNPNLLPVDGSTFENRNHALEPGANTSTSLAGGGTIEGTYSVKLTAIAAGPITATTPRFFVTPGTEYVAQFPYRVNTASTGKTASCVITWFGGTTIIGATPEAPVEVPNTTGWATAAYPAAVGTAPDGATSASVTFNFTPAAAGEFVHVDRVYAGAVKKLSGTLLDHNTASFEADVSGWTATGATVKRYPANLVVGGGYYTLEATASAAGSVVLRTAAPVGVSEGAEYVAYAMSQNVGASMAGTFAIEWVDAAGGVVGTSSVAVTYSTTNGRQAVVGTAPAGATGAHVVVRATATAAGQRVYLDDVSLRVAPNVQGNLLSYDEYSTESQLPSWTLDNGTGLIRTGLTSAVTDGYFGMRYTAGGAVEHTLTLDRSVPVTPGVTYAVGAAVFGYNPSAEASHVSARVDIQWLDGAGAPITGDAPDAYHDFPVPAGGVDGGLVTATRTAPESAASARVKVQVDNTSSLCSHYYVDNVYVKESVAEYVPVVDNETGSVTLTVNYVPPRTDNNDYLTIRRMDADGSSSIVRGYGSDWDRAPYPYEPLVVEDYEAPLGTRVWYDLVWSNDDGTETGARIGTRTFDSPVLPDGSYVWFKNVGMPALNVRVMVEEPPAWARAARSTTYPVVGRTNPVQITQVRAGRTASLKVFAWDADTHRAVNDLLGTGMPVLIQAMPGYNLDGNLYVSVGDVEAEPAVPDARDDTWRWTLAVVEIDRPAGGMSGSAGITWQTVHDNYATWDEALATRGTWTQVLMEG